MWFGFALVVAGILLLLDNLGILKGNAWNYIWPIVLIMIGISMIYRRDGCCLPKWNNKDKEDK